MFQFPWETVEDLAEARKFRENKKLKNDVEEKEDDENEKLTRRSRLIKTDYSPQVFAARCEAAGLHTSVSSDPEHLYIRVGATWERYEREAERIGFRKRVKEEYLNPMINLRDAENSAVYNEPGISDEDPLRPPERDRVLMVYCPFEPQKRHRFCSSLLAPNSLFSSAERQRLTQSIMEADMNQGGAGINVDADSEVWGYISGAPICLHDWEELNRLERIWHGGKPFGDHPSVFWNLQPFHEIREYYGESVTLYYAWMDLYVTWLGPLSLVGAICWIVYMCKDFYDHLENAVVFYGAFVIFWGIFFMEHWNRREADLTFMWDCLDLKKGYREHYGFPQRAVRRRHPVTAEWENYFNPDVRESRVNKSLLVMILFMILGFSFNVGAVFLGGYLQEKITFQPAVGPAIAAIGLVVAQQVTKIIWEQIATALTDWETHRYTVDYDSQLGFKMFGFELVMKFGSIFFIGFFKGPLGANNTWGIQGCKDSDGNETNNKFCDYEMMMQLLIVFIAEMTVGQFAEVVVPMILLWWTNYQNNKAEEEAAARAAERGVGSEPGQPTGAGVGITVEMKADDEGPKSAAKYQCKESHIAFLDDFQREERVERLMEFYADREAKGQPEDEELTEEHENEAEKESFWKQGGPNLDYQEMMIQFGFVTLFSIACPLVPVLALVNNIVEIRTDSFKMNETMQRPQFRRAENIGEWKGALNFMVWTSIIFNIGLILYFNHYKSDHQWFDGTDNLTLVSVIILAEHVIILFKLLCEQYVPDRTQWLRDALDGIEALEGRAMKDLTAKSGAWSTVPGVGNMHERKQHVQQTCQIKENVIKSHKNEYPELQKMEKKVKKHWKEVAEDEEKKWMKQVNKEAKKANEFDEQESD
eukprot:TRINITY_DN1400_c0_g1_i9.p1 TRINITY_DN1400_c0_g1~~TRINITY_DN1400_c0_g1_i9.p1  ORF type:complete len:873 (-),score=152.63 TRINITY_DN1400_c0_g1_i9:564-3182(-)